MGNYCSKQVNKNTVKTQSEIHNTQANLLFSQRNFKSAIEEYTKAITEAEATVPGYGNNNKDSISQDKRQEIAKYYSNRSNCYLFMGESEKAIADSDKVIEWSPLWYKGYIRKSRGLSAQNKVDESFEFLLLSRNKANDSLVKFNIENKKSSNSNNKKDSSTSLTSIIKSSFSKEFLDKKKQLETEYNEINNMINTFNKSNILKSKLPSNFNTNTNSININTETNNTSNNSDIDNKKTYSQAIIYVNKQYYYKAHELLSSIVAQFKKIYKTNLKNAIIPEEEKQLLKQTFITQIQVLIKSDLPAEALQIINENESLFSNEINDIFSNSNTNKETSIIDLFLYQKIGYFKAIKNYAQAKTKINELINNIKNQDINNSNDNKNSIISQLEKELENINTIIDNINKKELLEEKAIKHLYESFIEPYRNKCMFFKFYNNNDDLIFNNNGNNSIEFPFLTSDKQIHSIYKKLCFILSEDFKNRNNSEGLQDIYNNSNTDYSIEGNSENKDNNNDNDNVEDESFITATQKYNSISNSFIFKILPNIKKKISNFYNRNSNDSNNNSNSLTLSEIPVNNESLFKASLLPFCQKLIYCFIKSILLYMHLQYLHKSKTLNIDNSSEATISKKYLINRYGINNYNKYILKDKNNVTFFIQQSNKQRLLPFIIKQNQSLLPLFNQKLFIFHIDQIMKNNNNNNSFSSNFYITYIEQPDLFCLFQSGDIRRIDNADFIISDIFSLSKILIILKMILNNMSVISIIEVWFSSIWRKSTNDDFDKTCEEIINDREFINEYVGVFENYYNNKDNKNDNSESKFNSFNQISLVDEVIETIKTIKDCICNCSEMIDIWQQDISIDNICFFKKDVDNIEYMLYLFSGAVGFSIGEIHEMLDSLNTNYTNNTNNNKSRDEKYYGNRVFYQYHKLKSNTNNANYNPYERVFSNFYSTINIFIMILDKSYNLANTNTNTSTESTLSKTNTYNDITLETQSHSIKNTFTMKFLSIQINVLRARLQNKHTKLSLIKAKDKEEIIQNILKTTTYQNSNIILYGDLVDYVSQSSINDLIIKTSTSDKTNSDNTESITNSIPFKLHLFFSDHWNKEINLTSIYDFPPQMRHTVLNDMSKFFKQNESKYTTDNSIIGSFDNKSLFNLALNFEHKSSYMLSMQQKTYYLNEVMFKTFLTKNTIKGKIEVLNTIYNPLSDVSNQLSFYFITEN